MHNVVVGKAYGAEWLVIPEPVLVRCHMRSGTFDWCYHWDIGIIWLYSKLSVKFYLPDLLLASCLSVASEPLTVIRGIGD